MGYMLHHAIVVTCHDLNVLTEAAKKARSFGCVVLGPCDPQINRVSTMMVCPDGSKEGWAESHRGDQNRDRFVGYLNSQRYEDGSTSLEWVEVSYGGDDKSAQVVRHAWVKE